MHHYKNEYLKLFVKSFKNFINKINYIFWIFHYVAIFLTSEIKVLSLDKFVGNYIKNLKFLNLIK